MSDNETASWEPYLKELSEALAKTDNSVLILKFLGSLLTPKELQEVSTRWALVKLIDDGMSQRNIARDLGLSLCKITRGSKELKKENSPFHEMIGIYKKSSRS